MPRIRTAALAALLVVSLVVAFAAPGAGSTTASGAGSTLAGGRTPSADACTALADYYEVSIVIAVITGFAEAFEGLGEESSGDASSGSETTISTAEPLDADQLRNVFYLVLSPKLEDSTATLADEGPRSVRRAFARQRDVFAEGVEILRDLGLTRAQIEEIRALNLGVDEETPESLTGDLGVSEAEVEEAAERFGEELESVSADDGTVEEPRALQRLGVDCGVVPDDSLDCDELVSADLQQQLLEDTPVVEDEGGTCTYTVGSDLGPDTPEIAVEVYRSADAFGRFTEQDDANEVLDRDNVAREGLATSSGGKTCGRTLYSRDDATTIVVGICLPDDAEVPDDMLMDVRDGVAAVVG